MRLLTPFLPGEKVQTSGQYWVVHLEHRLPHKALLTEGERFPLCKRCVTRVLYEYASDLIIGGTSLQTDQDFSESARDAWGL